MWHTHCHCSFCISDTLATEPAVSARQQIHTQGCTTRIFCWYKCTSEENNAHTVVAINYRCACSQSTQLRAHLTTPQCRNHTSRRHCTFAGHETCRQHVKGHIARMPDHPVDHNTVCYLQKYCEHKQTWVPRTSADVHNAHAAALSRPTPTTMPQAALHSAHTTP
jgi:hypothetical protein